MLSSVILKVFLHKEDIEKRWANFKLNQLDLIQAWMILKKGWFYDLELLEICGQVSSE